MAVNNLPPIPQDKIEENPRWREWFRNLGNYIQQAQFGNIIWPITSGGTGATSAVGARNNLGLGSMAVQYSNNVAITGGTITSVNLAGSTIPYSNVSGTPTLGTIASQNANNVAITGGTIDGTPIGSITRSTGAFSSLTVDTLTGYLKGTGGTVSAVTSIPNTDITGLGTMSTENANNVAITGGSISGTTIDNLTNITTRNHNDLQNIQGGSAGQYYHLNSSQYNSAGTLTDYIEVYDRSASIALGATPALLIPASTQASNNITYNNTTGIFTFPNAGNFALSLNVNAYSTSANQFVYIYAEQNTGSGWTLNANSGKYYALPNGVAIQIVYANAVRRVAGQQIRYSIYSNGTKVTLQTSTLPGTSTVYVPAIRIQYS